MALCLAVSGSLGINDGDLCGVVCMEVKLKWVKENRSEKKEGTLADNVSDAFQWTGGFGGCKVR